MGPLVTSQPRVLTKRSIRRQRRRSREPFDTLLHLAEVKALALRSVYHELADILEHEIHTAALPAWEEHQTRLWDEYRARHPAPLAAGLD